jgi:hypothetical protein
LGFVMGFVVGFVLRFHLMLYARARCHRLPPCPLLPAAPGGPVGLPLPSLWCKAWIETAPEMGVPHHE